MFLNRRVFLFASLVSAVALAAPAAGDAGALRVVRTYTGWREAASFKRISEYFTGRENSGGEIVLRTHPALRGGYYFLIRLANPGTPVAARIVLQVVTPDSATPRNFTFDATLPSHDSVLDLGLTGDDWPDPTVHAVAWRFDVFDGSGQTLATGKSYLWDKPAGD
jgi:hypothetical protein